MTKQIPPHGGTLVSRVASADEAREWSGKAAELPSLELNSRQISDLEMIKGIEGMSYHDRVVVPIIENTVRECDLAESLEAAITALPPDEYGRLVQWLLAREQTRWDEQMDADSASGKLDFLFEEADTESTHGFVREWPPRT